MRIKIAFGLLAVSAAGGWLFHARQSADSHPPTSLDASHFSNTPTGAVTSATAPAFDSESLAAAKLVSDDEFLKAFRASASRLESYELARELAALRIGPSLLKRCVALIGPEDRDEFLDRYLDELDEKAPGDLALFVKAFPLPELDKKVQTRLVTSGFVYSPQDLEEWTAELTPSARVTLLDDAFGHCIPDARGVAEYIRLVPPESFEHNNAEKALSVLAISRPADALRIAKGCNAAIRDEMLAQVYSIVLDARKVADADDLMAAMEDAPSASRANLAAKLAQANCTDLPSARRLLSALSQQDRRGAEAQLLGQSSFALSDRRELLTRWVASGGVFQDVGPVLAGSVEIAAKDIASDTALNSPTDAIALVQDLPEGETKTAATRGLAEVVAFYNPKALFPLLALLPDGTARDVAIGELARSAVDDPARALGMAAAIGDPKTRDEAFDFIAKAWSNVDHELIQKLIDERKVGSPARADALPGNGKEHR